MELEKILEEIEKERTSYEAKHVKSYEKGLRFAAEAIRKHMDDGWIPVDERLPKEGEIVLTTYRTGCGEYDVTPDQWYKSSGWESALDDDIVAWRPLPDPYHPETTKP